MTHIKTKTGRINWIKQNMKSGLLTKAEVDALYTKIEKRKGLKH